MVTSHGVPLDEKTRERVRAAAEIIMNDFWWGSTEDGHDFWRGVYNKLKAIADERPTCESCGQKLPE